MGGQPPDLRALEALADKKLADPKSSKGAGMFIAIGAVVALGGAGFAISRGMGAATSDKAMIEVAKRFQAAVVKERVADEDGVVDVVVALAKAQGLTLKEDDIKVFDDEVEFEYIDSKSNEEACKIKSKPAELDKVPTDLKNSLLANAPKCKGNKWVIGYQVTVDGKPYEAYTLVPKFDDGDD